MAIGSVKYRTGENLEPVANAITSMGQEASKKDKPEILGQKIKAISTDATGVESEMLSGKTFYAAGQKKTGSMANRGAWTNRLGINSKIVIPAGYHNGNGYVDQSITTKGAQTYTPGTANQVINAGQYLSGAQTILGDPNLVPANIVKGKTIFGVKGSFIQASSPMYLISSGSPTTGSYRQLGSLYYSASVASNNVQISGYSNPAKDYFAFTALSNPIDVSLYKTLTLRGMCSNQYQQCVGSFGLVSANALSNANATYIRSATIKSPTGWSAVYKGRLDSWEITTYSLDITNLEGYYYLAMGADGSTSYGAGTNTVGLIYVYDVYLSV